MLNEDYKQQTAANGPDISLLKSPHYHRILNILL